MIERYQKQQLIIKLQDEVNFQHKNFTSFLKGNDLQELLENIGICFDNITTFLEDAQNKQCARMEKHAC